METDKQTQQTTEITLKFYEKQTFYNLKQVLLNRITKKSKMSWKS